ncbi:MAG: aspartate kinase [Proteobacteria bacterium]|nr:aspartate kinase [Pseudomonadota bacterium]
MSLVVQKYGGSSVASLDHLRRVAQHVATTARRGDKVLVTISAMGEQTDDLLNMALALSPKPPRRELDMLLTAGERISAALLAIALGDLGVPSLSLTGSQCGILTDETHGNARITQILGGRIRDNLAANRVVIVAGFQGVSTQTKEITTLGRGGSDLSAIALAAALEADACQLYKDVAGVYTCDPRSVAEARLLPRLSWTSMTALAWGGASVLHPRGAHLAAKFNLPFEIRSSLDLTQPGTRIHGSAALERPQTIALAHKRGMTLTTYRLTGADASSSLAQVLSWLWQRGEAPQVTQQVLQQDGSVDLTLVISSSLVSDLDMLLDDITAPKPGHWQRLNARPGLATIAVIGQGYKQSPETATTISQGLRGVLQFIDVSDQQILLGLGDEHLDHALKVLHRQLIDQAQAIN